MSEMAPEALPAQVTTSTAVPTSANLQYYAPAASNQFFTAEDIEKARREERDKLYPRISKQDERFKSLEEELSSLRTDRDRRAAEEEMHRKAAEDALRAKSEEELSAKQLIEQREREWNDRFDQVKREQEQARLMYEKDQQYLQLRNYIERRAREELSNELIGDELIDFITGNTEAEVESSIVILRDKTKRILDGMREGQAQTRASMPGVALTGQPPMGGPLDNVSGQNRQMTEEDIRGIPMSEWHKFRQQIGLDNASSNRGLYG